MKILIYATILILLGGCTSPSLPLEEIHQRVAQQVEMLIDKGYLVTPYIQINEVVSNDSSVIYHIRASDSPAYEGGELPSRVMKYKKKILCFIELDELEISRTKLFEQGIVDDSLFQANQYVEDSISWIMACRKYEDKQTLVENKYPYKDFLEYPELWDYYSGEKPYGKASLIILHSHDIIVPASYTSHLYDLEIDSLKQYIEKFSGKIIIRTLTDSSLIISDHTAQKMYFAVINGMDTLNLSLRDSFPIVIKPHDYKILKYDSEAPCAFLQKLPTQDIWMSMYKLFSDSTFCFLRINETPQKFRIMHNDGLWINFIKDSLSTRSRDIYNKGVYDKEERAIRFINAIFKPSQTDNLIKE